MECYPNSFPTSQMDCEDLPNMITQDFKGCIQILN